MRTAIRRRIGTAAQGGGALLAVLLLFASCQGAKTDPAPAPGQAVQGQGTGTGQRSGGAPGAQGGAGRQGRSVVVPVQVATVTAGALMATNTAAGAVSPETQSSVAAGASGTVKTIVHRAGDWVRAGDVVLQLDDAQLRLSLQLAQTALQNVLVTAGFDEGGKPSPTAQITLQIQNAQLDVAAKQRILAADQALFQIGGVTQTTLDNDQTAIQNALATLEGLRSSVQKSALAVQTASLQVQQAQLNLSNTGIKAPFDGQIAAVNVRPGEYVGANTAAFVLVSRQKVITFSVPPSDAPGLSPRTPVQFTYGGREYPASLIQIPAAPVGGLIPLTASLPPNLSPPLGTVGTITYSVELARGTLVPLQAVQSAENTTFVFTVSKANKVGKAAVGILAETGAYAAVTGVPVGASVILSPPPGLLVGATVQPQASTEVQAAPGSAAGLPAEAPGTGTKAPGTGQGGTWNGQRGQGSNGPAASEKATAASEKTPAAGPAAEAPGTRGSFDPASLTPEQKAAFQARRKAAAEAAGTDPAAGTGQTGQGTRTRRNPAAGTPGTEGPAAVQPAPAGGQ